MTISVMADKEVQKYQVHKVTGKITKKIPEYRGPTLEEWRSFQNLGTPVPIHPKKVLKREGFWHGSIIATAEICLVYDREGNKTEILDYTKIGDKHFLWYKLAALAGMIAGILKLFLIRKDKNNSTNDVFILASTLLTFGSITSVITWVSALYLVILMAFIMSLIDSNKAKKKYRYIYVCKYIIFMTAIVFGL